MKATYGEKPFFDSPRMTGCAAHEPSPALVQQACGVVHQQHVSVAATGHVRAVQVGALHWRIRWEGVAARGDVRLVGVGGKVDLQFGISIMVIHTQEAASHPHAQ
jgi:hypothetical protein